MLDLFARLANEAAVAGGAVTLLLGNHELMTLQDRHDLLRMDTSSLGTRHQAPVHLTRQRQHQSQRNATRRFFFRIEFVAREEILALGRDALDALQVADRTDPGFGVGPRAYFRAGQLAWRKKFSPTGEHGVRLRRERKLAVVEVCFV